MAYFMEWEPDIAVIIRLSSRLLTLFSNSIRLWQQLPMNPSYIYAPHGSSSSTDILLGKSVNISFTYPNLQCHNMPIVFCIEKIFSNYNYNCARGCFRRVRVDVLAFKNKHSVLSAKWLRKKYNKGYNHGSKILC